MVFDSLAGGAVSTVDDVLLGHVQAGAEVFGVTYKVRPTSPLAALIGTGADAGPSVQSLALAWLAQNLGGNAGGGSGGAAQLAELQALLQQGRAGQGGAPGMLQMPNEAAPLAQRPTDAAEPMMLWGEEPGDGMDSWHL